MNNAAILIAILVIVSDLMNLIPREYCQIYYVLMAVATALCMMERKRLNDEERALLSANAKLKADIRKLKGE